MIQKLPMETSSELQEAQRVSNYVQDWVIGIETLKPQASLDGNMDKVTADMSNKLTNKYPRIKLVRFCCTTKGSDLDIRISPGVASSFEFCSCLPQHSWDSVSDEIQLLISTDKLLHFLGSLMKYTNDATPCTPERQNMNFGNKTESYESDNGCQPNRDVLEVTTNPSEYAAFASLRMSKLFKTSSTAKKDIMGHLHSWTSKKSSMIPLGSNLGCIIRLNRMMKLTMHEESWNDQLMLVNWMYLFLNVGWTTLVLILLTPRSKSKGCVMRYLSCVRYGMMRNSGR